jgi:hypothetical protein
LGAFTVLLWFHRETLYLRDGRLVSAPRLGPLRMLAEYDLARVRNLRVEEKDGQGARVSFDYGEGSRSFGDALPRPRAEQIIATIRAAMPGPAAAAPPPVASPAVQAAAERPPLSLASALALIAANLVPLLGVLLAGWKLAGVIVLFWAESAVIAFYTLLKMAVVGRWLAIPAGIFFLAHFGGFMAIHFLFIYELFVIGHTGRAPGADDALAGVFAPLWPALLALFVSHGVSFVSNFLRRREHAGMTLGALMSAPYNRVVLMQLTLIFGGWILLLIRDPRPALALLIVLKVGADLYAHRRERVIAAGTRAPATAVAR